MSYCTTTDLVNLTGSSLSSTILQAIIDDADREINAYLAPHGLSGSGDACKTASLKLSRAGLMQYHRLSGIQPKSVSIGDTTSQDDPDVAIKALRAEAFALLDQWVSTQLSVSTTYTSRVRRVRGC